MESPVPGAGLTLGRHLALLIVTEKLAGLQLQSHRAEQSRQYLHSHLPSPFASCQCYPWWWWVGVPQPCPTQTSLWSPVQALKLASTPVLGALLTPLLSQTPNCLSTPLCLCTGCSPAFSEPLTSFTVPSPPVPLPDTNYSSPGTGPRQALRLWMWTH